MQIRGVKFIPVLYLAIIIAFTVGLLAQPMSTIDTVQNLEIARAQDLALANAKEIAVLQSSIADLQGSYNRGVGVGAGLGLALMLMQIFQIVSVAVKRGSEGPKLKDKY